jgi:hypothetical protein
MSSLDTFMLADLHDGQLPDGISSLVQALDAQYGESVSAVLLYGSCRRKADAADGLADLLVVVSSYRQAFGTGLLALLNWLLPPNVFYLESRHGERVIRCKYAVISEKQFRRRAESRMDHYFWARFSQPCRLASGNERIATGLASIRATAARSFSRRIAPLLTESCDAQAFWTLALATTYRCELRPEPAANARTLIEYDPDYWRELTDLLAAEPESALIKEKERYIGQNRTGARLMTRLVWQGRRISGKLFNLARLFKAAGTFSNGIDYIVWKVERHSGVRVEPTERMRRHPRLAAWGLAWRMWREGGFR